MAVVTTLAQAIAACKAGKLGTSACLDAIDKSDACGPNLPTATADGSGGVVFTCSAVPSAAKAAALLKEAEARVAASSGPPWLLIGGGVVGVGLLVYVLTR